MWALPLRQGGLARPVLNWRTVLSTDAPWLVLLAVISGGVALLWCFSVPFHGGPDEAAHFHVARFIQEYERLPVFAPEEMWLYQTEVGAVESYATFPPLAYLIGAALLPISNGTFWAARALSVISYVGTVLITFVVARRLLPHSRSVALSAAFMVALVPQVSFTGSYFNNDALALFETSILLYFLLVLWDNPRRRVFAATGLIIGALLLTKYTFYAVAGVALLAALGLARLRRFPRACGIWLLASTLLSAGWWFLRNWQLYGEPVPGRVVDAAKEAAGGNSLFVAADKGINILTLSFLTEFWSLTLKSFVASFGFQTVFLEPVHYGVFGAAALLGVVGAIHRLRRGTLTPRVQAAALISGAMVLGTVASAMAINVYGEWSPQGRYLFAALIPVAIGLSAGWHSLAARRGPLHWLPWLPVAGVAVLNGVSLLGWVVPTYFGAGPQHIVLQVDSPTGAQPAGRAIAIAGWSMLEAASAWQPFSPLAIAGYRRPVDGVVVYVGGPPGAGRALGEARYGIRRADVRDFFGRIGGLGRVGYELTAPPGSLRRGKHTLFVCAYDRGEPEPKCKQRRIEVL